MRRLNEQDSKNDIQQEMQQLLDLQHSTALPILEPQHPHCLPVVVVRTVVVQNWMARTTICSAGLMAIFVFLVSFYVWKDQPFGGLMDSASMQQQPHHRHESYTTLRTVVCDRMDQNPTKSSRMHQKGHNNITHRVIVHANPNTTKIAWLMSFPNSGTTYTAELVRTVTQQRTASNYGPGNSQGIVYQEQPGGPFWDGASLLPELHWTHPRKFILTKTHCGGYCMNCSPEQYTETTYSFRHKCLSTTHRHNHSIHEAYYSPRLITKAVHLVRDPFDNVVARFHLEQGKRTNYSSVSYSNDREGFRQFCWHLKKQYRREERDAEIYNRYHPDLFNLTKDVPCRADFFRYVEWHNLAFFVSPKAVPPNHVFFF